MLVDREPALVCPPVRADSAAGRVPDLVSVIIPLRDKGRWIGAQMEALASQRCARPWEVVVADNGSADHGPEVARSFGARLPALRVVDASGRRGVGHARNAGAAAALGDLLLFCDGDDVVAPGWIEAMVEAAAHADVVGGRLRWDQLNDALIRATHPAPDMQRLEPAHGFLPYAPGGNLAMWADVARDVGWDERFRDGGSDLAFGWQAQLAGYTLAFAPAAVVQQRFRQTVGAMAGQQLRFGAAVPKLLDAFREHGVAMPDNGPALRRWWWLLTHAHHLGRSAALRRQWIRRAAFRVGRLAGSIRHRTLCL